MNPEKSLQNTDIISQIAKDKVVEGLIENISKKKLTDSHLDDLAQDIYIALLEKPPALIIQLYEKNEINFYIARMVVNNLRSNLSPYYYKYIKPEQHKILNNNDKDITNTTEYQSDRR